MAELKTQKTNLSVEALLKKITEAQKQKDAFALVDLMEKATKAKAKMWGTAIIGFGDKQLVYESGRTLDWFVMGFSPRKQNLALYIHGAVEDRSGLLKSLGKHKTGKGCLYVQTLQELDIATLKKIIKNGLND